MDKNFEKVKNYLLDLETVILKEDAETSTFIISQEDEGINNMIIACADPILIMEQPLFKIKADNMSVYKQLLQKNRDIIHGAFVLDNNNTVLYRDTLQIGNLDLNELEGSLKSLSLLLSEYSDKILQFAK